MVNMGIKYLGWILGVEPKLITELLNMEKTAVKSYHIPFSPDYKSFPC